MTRLLIVLSFAALGFTAAQPARACDEYCEEYLEHLEERAEERAYAREEAMEEGEAYAPRRRGRGKQRQATPSAPKVSAAKRSARTNNDDEDGDEPKKSEKSETSETSGSKSEVATAGGCKQYFPAVGMALSVPCK
jgi:hypothetical protein